MLTNDINIMIFWICVAIGIVVYAVIIWSLVAFRKSKKQEVSFHKHTATEVAWTVIPLLIIIAMTVPAAKLLTQLYPAESNSQGVVPELSAITYFQLSMVIGVNDQKIMAEEANLTTA